MWIIVLFILILVGAWKSAEAEEEAQMYRRSVQKKYSDKPNLTYVDGNGRSRYINDKSLVNGGRYSQNPAERARYKKFEPIKIERK